MVQVLPGFSESLLPVLVARHTGFVDLTEFDLVTYAPFSPHIDFYHNAPRSRAYLYSPLCYLSCITGTGCLFPHTIRRLYDLSIAGLKGDPSALAEAMTLQDRSEPIVFFNISETMY